ncbi:MAG: putative PEP-binding protein [Methanomicrobiales archaeon]
MDNQSGTVQDNPFEVLDVNGVGRLMEPAVKWGRHTRPNMKVSICGELGGHPASIRFCHSIGLTYVSCSVPRIPIAWLVTAQATILEDQYVADKAA